MAELRVELPSIVAVLAPSGTVDRLEAPAGTTSLRVAPREALVVGTNDAAAVHAAIDDPSAFVDDVSDAWVALVLAGDDVADVFARISELELPPTGFVQGDVARSAAKVLVEPGRVTLLVPSMLAAHVEERIREDAAEVLDP